MRSVAKGLLASVGLLRAATWILVRIEVYRNRLLGRSIREHGAQCLRCGISLVVPRRVRHRLEVRDWENAGRPFPVPHQVKLGMIQDYARRFAMNAMVETGTWRGYMAYDLKDTFCAITTIELHPGLHRRAKRLLKGCGHVTLIQGDSGEELARILPSITHPCLFWLDAHYSGMGTARAAIDTPIMQEVLAILDHPVCGHVILIDDARNFTGRNGYPTIEELWGLIAQRHPDWTIHNENDVIRIHL